MKDFSGRVAVVTGAASGIGLGVTERLLAEGMKVVLADVEPGPLARESGRLADAGGDVLSVECDVREAAAVEALAQRTLSHFGAVHVVFNNAGVAPAGPMLETDAADWHAVVGMTESLYRELEATDVGVHCLCPNLVKTQIFHSERNRDDPVEPTAAQTATMAPLREAIAAVGISPEQLAGDVVEAMRNDRFWIFTHAITPQAASVRFADIEAERNPSNPYKGINVVEGLENLS